MEKEFGKELILPSYQGRVSDSYEKPSFLQALEDCEGILERKDSIIFHRGRNRLGIVTLPLDQNMEIEVVVKEFRPQGVERVKAFFSPGKARKAWRASNILRKVGIDTPFPIAYLEKRGHFSKKTGYFLSERISGAKELRHYWQMLPPSEYEGFLSALAKYVFSCHESGILHRDLSDGNVLVSKDEKEGFKFYLVDTNRIRIKKKITLFMRVKNLIRFGIPGEYQFLFLKKYFRAEKVKKPIFLCYKINKMCYSHYLLLKKRLRLKKLAQILRLQ